jgi:hypothetical protein
MAQHSGHVPACPLPISHGLKAKSLSAGTSHLRAITGVFAEYVDHPCSADLMLIHQVMVYHLVHLMTPRQATPQCMSSLRTKHRGSKSRTIFRSIPNYRNRVGSTGTATGRVRPSPAIRPHAHADVRASLTLEHRSFARRLSTSDHRPLQSLLNRGRSRMTITQQRIATVNAKR